MSIVLAVRTDSGCLIAGDSQSITADGISAAPFEKVFLAAERLLCGYVGLQVVSWMTVEEHVRNIALPSDDLARAASIVREGLTTILNASNDKRHIQVLLADRSGIVGIDFRPGDDGMQSDVTESADCLLRGDGRAQHMIRMFIAAECIRIGDATATANQLLGIVGMGVNFSGLAEGTQLPSCCDPVTVLAIDTTGQYSEISG